MLILSFVFIACKPDTEDSSKLEEPVVWPEEILVHLLPDPGPNLLLPMHMAVDSAHRRAWIVSLVASVVAEIDLDSGTWLGNYAYGEGAPSKPLLETDGDGYLWVSGNEANPLYRIEPETHTVEVVHVPGRGLNQVVGRAAGGVYGLTVNARGVGQLAEVNADLSYRLTDLPGVATALAWVHEPDILAVAMLEERGQFVVQLYNPATMESVGHCGAPESPYDMLPLPGSRLAASFSHSVGVLDYDGNESILLNQGSDLKELLPVTDGFVVMDRLGDETAAGLNWGIGRVYNAELELIGSYTTAKHTGYGDLDTVTGLAWANSEGTDEIVAFNPENGAFAHRVEVGTHLEDQAWSPLYPDDVWYSGRLSRTLARIHYPDGTVERLPDFGGWPVSPVFRNGELWFVDQLTQDLWVVDGATMEVLAHHDLDLPDNPLLTFDSMVYDSTRDQFYLSDSYQNLLLVVGTDGVEKARWPLPGTPISDLTLTGRVQVGRMGDSVIVLRTTDGLLSKVDPEKGVVAQVSLSAAEMDSFRDITVPAPLFFPKEGSCFYAGTVAFDAATLERCDRPVLPVAQLIGEVDGQYVGWGDGKVALLDADMGVVKRQSMEEGDLLAPVPLYIPDLHRLSYWNSDVAEVHYQQFP